MQQPGTEHCDRAQRHRLRLLAGKRWWRLQQWHAERQWRCVRQVDRWRSDLQHGVARLQLRALRLQSVLWQWRPGLRRWAICLPDRADLPAFRSGATESDRQWKRRRYGDAGPPSFRAGPDPVLEVGRRWGDLERKDSD